MIRSPNVNRPTDPKQKEADVNRKLQVYGIISAFKSGKVPSNEQIDIALNSFLESRALSNPSQRLSPDGQGLVADVREVVKQAKNLLLSKNDGNLLQDFIWQTQQFDPKHVSLPNAPVDKEKAQHQGNQALEGLRTVGTLLVTNGQFRKLLHDATTLLRDMAGDAATNAAAHVRPTKEDLAQMDAPAESNTWHKIPDLPKGPMKGNGNGILNDETREKARARHDEYRERAKVYLSHKMPKERREQTIWRLKKMVIECQQHPDYYQAIQTLLDLAEEYSDHANRLAREGTDTVRDSVRGTQSAMDQAMTDLKTLIERFANGTSTDDLWASVNAIYDDADNDPQLRSWFKAINYYIRRCLQEPGYVLDDDSNVQWNRLYDEGNYLLRDKYRGKTDRVVDEIKFLSDQFDQDPHNKAFAASLTRLFDDLGNDENGKPTFKRHLVKDLTEVIIPAVFENVAYIPVPRIEYSDPQFDAVIENLVLESDNFMPNVLEIASANYMLFGRKKIASRSMHSVDVKIAGIQMDLRDVSYYIKRKGGFPSITDTGVANFLLAGDGFTSRMRLSKPDKHDKQHFFKVDRVDVSIKNLKVKLAKSRYKTLFNIFRPLMLKVLRPVLQKALEKAIKDQASQLDSAMFQIKQEADRAHEQARDDPKHTPNIYSRYATAAQNRVLRGRKEKKAQAVVADKKVNYTITKEDSILPNIQLPGGISSKAREYRDLAHKGDKWESPVFSIGNAAHSRDIPATPRVVRKPPVTGHITNGNVDGGFGGPAANVAPPNGNALNGGALNGNNVNGNTLNGNCKVHPSVLKGASGNGNMLNGNTPNGNCKVHPSVLDGDTVNGSNVNGNMLNETCKIHPVALNPAASTAY